MSDTGDETESNIELVCSSEGDSDVANWYALVVPDYGRPHVIERMTVVDLVSALTELDLVGLERTYLYVFEGVRHGITHGGRFLVTNEGRFSLEAPKNEPNIEIVSSGYLGFNEEGDINDDEDEYEEEEAEFVDRFEETEDKETENSDDERENS